MSRRANGEGTYIHILPTKCENCKRYGDCEIRNDPKGKCRKRDRGEYWVYQYYVRGLDGKMRRNSKQARTRKELQAVVDGMREEADGIRPNAVTVGQWCDYWRDKVLPDTVKKSTLDYYTYMLRYLPDSLRDLKLVKLGHEDLREFFRKLRAHGAKQKPNRALSTTTVMAVRSALISCFDEAIREKLMSENPARKVRPMKPRDNENVEITFLTLDEMRRLIRVADSYAYRQDTLDLVRHRADLKCRQDIGTLYLLEQASVVIALALSTGMRIGEIFGLTPRCIDFKNNTVSVKKNLQNGKLVSPKTKYSVRTISVSPKTMRRLRGWLDYQRRYAEEMGDFYKNDLDLVFTGCAGRPVNANNFRARYFDRMVKVAGLPDTTVIHSLRHSHATYQLCEKHMDYKTLSRRLGHSSVAFTLKVYSHVVPELERNIVDTMDDDLFADDDKTGQ